MSLFMIVGSKEPLYQMEIKQQRKNRSTEDSIPMNHFTLHAALDIIDEQMWRTPNMALKVVDQFNGQLVSAYITATNMKLMLLHESRNEDGIKGFFQDVHELFIKVRTVDTRVTHKIYSRCLALAIDESFLYLRLAHSIESI